MAAGMVQAMRLHFSTSSTYPALLGAALALGDGCFDPSLFLLIWSSTVIGHALMELKDEAGDFQAYRATSSMGLLPPTLFSGGSGAMTGGLLTERAAAGLLACLSSLYAVLAAAVVLRAGWFMLVFGAIGLIWMLGYSDPRLRLSSRGLGEVGLLICFGPLIGLGTAVALALETGGTLSWGAPVVWALVMVPGFLQFAMIHIQEVFDLEEDRSADKRTLVVRFGTAYAARAAAVSLGLALVLVGLSALLYSPWLLLSVPALLWGLAEIRLIRQWWHVRAVFEHWLARYPLYRVHGVTCLTLLLAILLNRPVLDAHTLLLLGTGAISWALGAKAFLGVGR